MFLICKYCLFISCVCFFFCWRKNHWSWIFIHSNKCLYIYIWEWSCVSLQLLAVCVYCIVNVCLYMMWMGGIQEWSIVCCKEYFIFYLDGSLWRVFCCNDQFANSFILLVFIKCVWQEYSACEIVYDVYNTLNDLQYTWTGILCHCYHYKY